MKHWSWPMRCFTQLKVLHIHRMTFICSSKGLLAEFCDSPWAKLCISKRVLQATTHISAVRKQRRSQGCSDLGSSTYNDGSLGYCLHFFHRAFQTKHIHPWFSEGTILWFSSAKVTWKTVLLHCEALIALQLWKLGLNKLSGCSRLQQLMWICLYLGCINPKKHFTIFTLFPVYMQLCTCCIWRT